MWTQVTNYHNGQHFIVLIRHCNCYVLIILGVWTHDGCYSRNNSHDTHVFPAILQTSLIESKPNATQQQEISFTNPKHKTT
jgi:hypothetical protein